jgi:hypothetical protein
MPGKLTAYDTEIRPLVVTGHGVPRGSTGGIVFETLVIG